MSDLRITAVKATLVEGPRPWLFAFVHTDAGITGIGEVPRTTHRPADVERLGERIVGADPFETERLFGAGGTVGADPHDRFTTTIAGGLDMACWDIKGKALGVPTYELLGGTCRDRVRLYANGWDFPAREIVGRYHGGEAMEDVLPDVREELATAAAAVAEEGYTAMKFSPFQWGDGPTTTGRELSATLSAIEAVAEAVPDEVDLLIEGHCHLAVDKAVTAARALERFDPGFYEEPVPAELEPLARVAAASPVPIATGERFVTHRGFTSLLDRTDVAVVQPDVGRAGGITELVKIAAMASARRVGFAPHNAAGPVMTHAALHVDAVTPAFMIQESFEANFHPDWSHELLVEPLAIEDGSAAIPDRPGLGVTIDESVLDAHAIEQAG